MKCNALLLCNSRDFDGLEVEELAEWLLVIDPSAVHLHQIMLDIHQLQLKVPTRMDQFSDEKWWSDMLSMRTRHKRLQANQLTSNKDTCEINFEQVHLT